MIQLRSIDGMVGGRRTGDENDSVCAHMNFHCDPLLTLTRIVLNSSPKNKGSPLALTATDRTSETLKHM